MYGKWLQYCIGLRFFYIRLELYIVLIFGTNVGNLSRKRNTIICCVVCVTFANHSMISLNGVEREIWVLLQCCQFYWFQICYVTGHKLVFWRYLILSKYANEVFLNRCKYGQLYLYQIYQYNIYMFMVRDVITSKINVV